MKNKRILESIVSFLAVILAYTLSFGLSLWREAARLYLVQHWGSARFIIQMIAIVIILATLLMALNWFLNQKLRPNVLVAWSVFISGTILIFSCLFPISVNAMPLFLKHMIPGALLAFATTFIMVSGIIGIARSLKNRNRNVAHETDSGEPPEGFIKNSRALELAICLLLILLMLVMAYGLDLLRDATRTLILGTFRFRLFVASLTAIHAALMTSFIALNWLINSKIRPSVIVSRIIFLVGGLLLILPLVLEFVTAIPFVREQWFRMSLLYI